MVDRLGPEGFYEAEIIGDFRGVRQQLADPCAGLAVLGELKLRAGERQDCLISGHPGEPLAVADGIRERLAVELVELGLVVEKVVLGRAAGHEQVDDPFRLRSIIREQFLTGLSGG